jgi:uncharacterized protein
MIVVSDTTPLRYLVVLGIVDLLPRLFGQIHCPKVVLSECAHPHAPSALKLWVDHKPDWLQVHEVPELDEQLRGILDDGEASAITLARQLGAKLVLVDEKRGRRCANEAGLATAGTLNLLAQAAVKGWIDFHKTVGRLMSETNFYASPEIVEAAWRTAHG